MNNGSDDDSDQLTDACGGAAAENLLSMTLNALLQPNLARNEG
jgi:hypothetical protein